MGIPNSITQKYPYLVEESILVTYRGSIAHGMYIPQNDPNSIDDKDILAVVMPGLNYYFGLEMWGSRGTKEHFIDEWDIVSYEIKKFVGLLEKSNPNVLGTLWLEKNHYIKKTEGGEHLINNRDLFTTKQAYHSFCGYAYQQLVKMEKFQQLGYMGEKRRALVDKFGYDTKNAAHLIRLLRMGIEFLNEGYLYVQRTSDGQQLLEIKRGAWKLEQVKAEADLLFKRIENAYDHSSLPSHPNREKINTLCKELFEIERRI